MILITAALGAQPCDPATLNPLLAQAENAYLKGDSTELDRAVVQARRELRCEEPPTPAIARFLADEGLRSALRNDWTAAEQWFRGALLADPLRVTPLDGADVRVALAWQRAQERPAVWSPSRPVMVNGTSFSMRPDVSYLGSTNARGKALRWTGIGVGAVAIGLYAGALASRSTYDEVKGGPEADVVPVYRRTNGLFYGAFGAGVLGTGLIATSFAF